MSAPGLRVLFLSRWFPYPADNGAKIRVYNLLQALGERHSVSLVSFRAAEEGAVNGWVRRLPLREIHEVAWPEYRPRGARAMLGYLSARPRSFVATFSSAMAETIRLLARRGRFDLVIASEIQMAAYSRFFRGTPALFEEVETGVYFDERMAAGPLAVRPRLMFWKHARFLRTLLRDFARCTVVSEAERRILARIAPEFEAVDVIPNAVRAADYDGFGRGASKAPDTLVFAGSAGFYPNRDAMTWFLERVYPKIVARVSGVRLTIVGNRADLPLPPGPNVLRTGYVDDVRPIVARAAVSIAPIRRGGGTRLKILEAMALGAPVVATRKAAEGLDVRDNEHLLLADTPEAFAAAVVRLLENPEEARTLAANADRQLRAVYDWDAVKTRFLEVVEKAALARA